MTQPVSAIGEPRSALFDDLPVDRKIVEKSGTWFAYSGERLGQGRENVKQFLKDNPAIFKSIEDRVRAELGLTVLEAAAV